MKLFWILFTFRTSCIFCNDEEYQSIRNFIGKTFGYDCQAGPQRGQILFWKISSVHSRIHQKHFKLQEYTEGITQLQPNETYLILTKIEKFRMHIYYWVGSRALLDDKKEAAKHTIYHYLLLKKYYKLTFCGVFLSIQREKETIESDLFKCTIRLLHGNIITKHFYLNYLQTGILSMYPNLYVVRGGDTTRMKKVPVSTLWLKNDTCMVLEIGYSLDGWLPIYFHCGVKASVKVYNRAKSFAYLLCSYYGVFHPLTCLENRTEFKSFIELLEDNSVHRPNEVDNSSDHLKHTETFVKYRDARIWLSRISSDPVPVSGNRSYTILERGLLKENIISRPIVISDIMWGHANHIMNTDSISGVIVQFGSSVLEETIVTMQHAEEYVHNIESNSPRPTRLQIDGATFSNFNRSSFDCKINFIDYPPQAVPRAAVGELW